MSGESNTAEIKTSGEIGHKKLDKLTPKELLEGLAGLIVLVVLVIVGLWLHAYFHVPTPQEISKAAAKGDFTKEQKLIQKAISKTKDKKQQAGLYQELAGSYSDNKQPDQAIQAYQQAAADTTMTANIARNIGDIYLGKGDKSQAITYYQKAINLWPKSDPLYSAEVRALQQEIAGLKS